MAMKVGFVQNLADVVNPVERYLNDGLNPDNPFERQVLLVPLIGVRSWLTPILATRLGATNEHGDGVLANVDVQYIGYLQTLVQAVSGIAEDPWEINRVAFATFQALGTFPTARTLESKYNGRLNAARRIAERFENYAARRPDLIQSWDRNVIALGDLTREKYEWQYQLWREVRGIINQPPWPVVNAEVCSQWRSGVSHPSLPSRLMLVGFESISAAHLELLDALSNVIDIEILFVQQSPELAHRWSKLSEEVVSHRNELPIVSSFDFEAVHEWRLPTSWMRGSFELELLLSAYGLPVQHQPSTQLITNESFTLLQRIQHGVAFLKNTSTESSVSDFSVQIHRAHALTRQVEVIHDALLHAFEDLPNLEPHEVVILCADMATAAPILEAVFEKTVKNSSGKDVKIPLSVADRSLGELSAGAELATALLALISSKFDLEHFLNVATHPLVAKNFRATTSDVAVWVRHLEQSRLRWGLDSEHRTNHHLQSPTLTTHTWLESIERSLLGAVMDVTEAPLVTSGGVRPLPFIDSSETEALVSLAGILSPLVKLELSSRTASSVQNWCEELNECFSVLCGESAADLDEMYFLIDSVQKAAAEVEEKLGTPLAGVSFAQFAEHIRSGVIAASGRQPLRTGAVTAASFAPLRMIPYRVVCVLGFDDETLPKPEAEGDDLVAAIPMLGDTDPRLETRRAFLDAIMATSDRFIVTCNGRSIKNNKKVPLVTPLAEFIDFCQEFGVTVSEKDEMSSIEHSHWRHLGSPGNFLPGKKPVKGVVWSHDSTALRTAQARHSDAKTHDDGTDGSHQVNLAPSLNSISSRDIETLLLDPLSYYLEKGLRIRNEWESNQQGISLPLVADQWKLGQICLDVFDGKYPISDLESQLRAADVLQVAPYDKAEIENTIKLVGKFVESYTGLLPSQPKTLTVALDLDGLPQIVGDIARYHSAEAMLAHVSFQSSSSVVNRDAARMFVRALIAIAAGHSVQAVTMFHIAPKGDQAIQRTITISPAITTNVAQEILSSLVRVEPIARTLGCPQFGETAFKLFGGAKPNRSDAEDSFEEFVENDRVYPRSKELVVFGVQPDFDDVYADSSGLLKTFFAAYFSVHARFGGSLKGWTVQ